MTEPDYFRVSGLSDSGYLSGSEDMALNEVLQPVPPIAAANSMLPASISPGDLTSSIRLPPCHCELCQARCSVSMRGGAGACAQNYNFFLNQVHMSDVLNATAMVQQTVQPQFSSHDSLNTSLQFSEIASPMEPPSSSDSLSISPTKSATPNGTAAEEGFSEDTNFSTSLQDPLAGRNLPFAYLSDEGIIHIVISSYISLEMTSTAYRLINFINNSAIMINHAGDYGFIYHYCCRGAINICHQKLCLTFNGQRQLLLRNQRPSFVKNTNQKFYRLTATSWHPTKSVAIEVHEEDKSAEYLRRSLVRKMTASRLNELMESSNICIEGDSIAIYIGSIKIEYRITGDVYVSWSHKKTLSYLHMSPMTRSFSISTSSIEIMSTPKEEVYISFFGFFTIVGPKDMRISSGSCNPNSNGEDGPTDGDTSGQTSADSFNSQSGRSVASGSSSAMTTAMTTPVKDATSRTSSSLWSQPPRHLLVEDNNNIVLDTRCESSSPAAAAASDSRHFGCIPAAPGMPPDLFNFHEALARLTAASNSFNFAAANFPSFCNNYQNPLNFRGLLNLNPFHKQAPPPPQQPAQAPPPTQQLPNVLPRRQYDRDDRPHLPTSDRL